MGQNRGRRQCIHVHRAAVGWVPDVVLTAVQVKINKGTAIGLSLFPMGIENSSDSEYKELYQIYVEKAK